MRSRSWHSCAVAIALLVIQVGVSTLGTIGMCVDRPHMHGGVPAPDCLMKQPQPVSTTSEPSPRAHHHQHGSNTPADGARLGCSCAADPLTLMTTEIAVVPNHISIALPDIAALSTPVQLQSASDVRITPLSPPPRPSLS
jgi:hypothetical protein